MNKTPEIEYPCDWTYKVIVQNEDDVYVAVGDVIATRAHTLTPSNQSKKGKYLSYTLVIPVDSEEDRNGIFYALKSHPLVAMVL